MSSIFEVREGMSTAILWTHLLTTVYSTWPICESAHPQVIERHPHYDHLACIYLHFNPPRSGRLTTHSATLFPVLILSQLPFSTLPPFDIVYRRKHFTLRCIYDRQSINLTVLNALASPLSCWFWMPATAHLFGCWPSILSLDILVWI